VTKVGKWLCGYVVTWIRGYVVKWLSGYVVTWLSWTRECSLNCVSFINSIFKVNKKLVNNNGPVS